MTRHLFAALAAAFSMVVGHAVSAAASDAPIGHLRLVDRLDRPIDGYCLDVLGVGSRLRTDLPLFAHNCKTGLTPDSAVRLAEDGRIVFHALDLCVTAFGVNRDALPGSPVLLRGCAEAAPFFDAGRFQRFERDGAGRMRLNGGSLCLAVGRDAATTFSAADRWRPLTVEDCAAAPPALSVWEFNTGPFPRP